MKVGRARADAWIEKNFDRLGDESTSTFAMSTFDRGAAFLAPGEESCAAASAITGVHPHHTLSAFPGTNTAPYILDG
jgi:hypothetical protein